MSNLCIKLGETGGNQGYFGTMVRQAKGLQGHRKHHFLWPAKALGRRVSQGHGGTQCG